MAKFICFLGLFTLPFFAPTLSGQEFLKSLPLEKSSNVIVRTVDTAHWLVYNKYMYKHGFISISETGTIADIMELPSTIRVVNDFEILNGIVYFCGESNMSKAVMGSFPLQGFPSSQTSLLTVAKMTKFKKMDVRVMNNLLHVVMTGESAAGSHIVDARPSQGTQWTFHISQDQDSLWYDDVAITDNRVVVSGRTKANKNGRLSVFNYPSLFPSLFFQNVQPIKIIRSQLTSEVLLALDMSYEYVYMANSSMGPCIGLAHETTSVWQQLLGDVMTPSNCNGIDLGFNSQTGQLDILASGVSGASSCMLHPHNSFVAPVSITGHGLGGNKELMSIDYVPGMSGVFVAAGECGSNCHLFLCRYKRNLHLGCFDTVSSPCDVHRKWTIFSSYRLLYENFFINAENIECTNSTIAIVNECTHNDKNK